jgi:AcrR family transcriptional regulator
VYPELGRSWKAISHTDQKVLVALIDAATDLFAEKGYAGSSIRDFSQRMDMSIATLYYYFENKEELLFTILLQVGDELLEVIEKARDECDDPLEGLSRMILGHLRLTERAKKGVKIYVEEQHNLSRKFWKIIYKQHRKIYDTYLDQLKRIEELGLLSVESLPVAAFGIFGITNWFYRWYREDGDLPLEDAAKMLLDITFHGIVKPAKRQIKGSKAK